MKQVLARSGEIAVMDVPAPKLLPGCVLVRTAASLVSAGTERAASEFAGKNLLQKARTRPDLVAQEKEVKDRGTFIRCCVNTKDCPLYRSVSFKQKPPSGGYFKCSKLFNL